MGALSIVQAVARAYNATDGGTATVHWGSMPVSGNLLIILISLRDGSAPTPNTGWTEDTTHRNHSASTGQYTAVFYKYAGISESSTPVVDTTSRQQWELAAWEISGVAGTYATDVVDWHSNSAVLVNGDYPYATASFNTSTSYQLILAAAHTEGPTTALLATMSGLTVDAIYNSPDADGFSAKDGGMGGHKLVISSGTAVTTTVDSGPNGSYAEYMVVALQSAAGSESGAVAMALSGVSFAATESGKVVPAAGMALRGVSFAAAGNPEVVASASLALGGVTIAVAAFDLTAEQGVQFSTFGA